VSILFPEEPLYRKVIKEEREGELTYSGTRTNRTYHKKESEKETNLGAEV